MAVRERMWIHHDGAPPPFSVDVRNLLMLYFLVAGLEGEALFHGLRGHLTRSPDLRPLHYFLWEYVKSLVFETPVETDMELVARIVAACDIIKTHQGYLSGCGRILYTNVMLALRLVAVNLSNCCKMQNGTLIVFNVLYL